MCPNDRGPSTVLESLRQSRAMTPGTIQIKGAVLKSRLALIEQMAPGKGLPAVLGRLSGIREAVAILRQDGGERYLAAYVVPSGAEPQA